MALAAATSMAPTSCDTRSAPADPLHVDELPRLTYVEEIRIGSRDDPEGGFSRIGDLEVGADRTVYVLETQAREVRVFAPDGRRLRTVGGPGEGPGEFSRPGSIGLIGDTLWVRESSGQRISWFGPDGALVHETPGTSRLPVPTDVPGMTLYVVPGEPRADGFVGTSYNRIMGGGAADRPFSYPVVRFDRDGNVVDTIRWDTVRPGPTVRVGGRALHPPALRPASPVVEEVGDGRVEVRWWLPADRTEGGMEVVRTTANGDTLHRTELRYGALPLPGSVRDSLLELPEGMGRSYGVSDQALAAAMESGMDLPDHRPPLRSTEWGSDGSLWMELNGTSPDSADWVLLDAGLTVRGRLTLPVRTEPRHIDGSTVWAVELDELDVPWLVRLRVR